MTIAFLEANFRILQAGTLGLTASGGKWNPGGLEQHHDVHWRAASVHWIPVCNARVSGTLLVLLHDLNSLLRIKALIFVLLRAFRFELAVPRDDLITRSTVVRRPLVRSEPDKGIQMPMFITPRQLQTA